MDGDKNDSSPVKETVTDVSLEDLGRTIDELIERPQGMSNEEYERIATVLTLNKWGGK